MATWMEVMVNVEDNGYATVGVFFDLPASDLRKLKEKIEELGDFKCMIFVGEIA